MSFTPVIVKMVQNTLESLAPFLEDSDSYICSDHHPLLPSVALALLTPSFTSLHHPFPSLHSFPTSLCAIFNANVQPVTCVQGDYLEADRKRALVPLKSTVEAEVRQ